MAYKFGLIGYPIKHSLSPWIHEHFLERTDSVGRYDLYEIPTDNDFSLEIQKLKAQELDGFNITVPYKEKIIPYLDELDEQAKNIGAVNTVVHRDGKWIGYNTDGLGYVRALETKYPSLKLEESKQQQILLLGAGGAAKGIYFALLTSGYQQITIANRSLDRAKQLAVNENTKVVTLTEAEQTIDRYDIIIQTSSVGMKPNSDRSVIDIKKLQKDAVVSDIVYQPLMTKILQDAKSAGGKVHFGHTMLLYQAQYAFEIWTGKQPDMYGLDQALQNKLEG